MSIDFPRTLNGAKVLSISKTEANFGAASSEDGSDVPIAALAVAQYDDADDFYLFASDADWEVVGDLFYDTISDAKQDTERFYQTGPIEWINREEAQTEPSTGCNR